MKLKHQPSKVHVKKIEEIINNYCRNYHEDPASKRQIAALPPKKRKNAVPAVKYDSTLPLTQEVVDRVEAYAKLNVGQLVKILQIDAKFVSLMCMALLSKLYRDTIKYHMLEVRYLIFVLLRELMQTPLVGF